MGPHSFRVSPGHLQRAQGAPRGKGGRGEEDVPSKGMFTAAGKSECKLELEPTGFFFQKMTHKGVELD